MEHVKPFSQSCINNRQPILTVLQRVFATASRVLEIGSGTGQHAVFFARELPHVRWQATDLAENLPGIRQWIADQPAANLLEPLMLDVTGDWPAVTFDAVFSANTAHIMPWEAVQIMLTQVADRLPPGGVFALYGPFNYEGAYTSESNSRFDTWLKARDSAKGIRDFEKINGTLRQLGLELMEDNAMPANNRLLVWRKPL